MRPPNFVIYLSYVAIDYDRANVAKKLSADIRAKTEQYARQP
ncbi:hypothetical protein Pla110_09920 [Polystyrenella longa]|uniref:Uncharacterized protein n=1 Tax=Polystyrenella longa TaxID=2528007 RepID=A0A518CJ80_9PLAN|nr:hypothetical protein Pla110_09920 [Polystyrenella longa]